MLERTPKERIQAMHKIACPVISNTANAALHQALPLNSQEKKEALPIQKQSE